jgi:sugar phosphate isomerase/epimerase
MYPSIWTSMYYQQPPLAALRTLAGQGWEAFELSCEHIGMLGQGGDAALEEFARGRDDLGVAVNQCHCTITVDVASPDAGRRASDLAQVHRDLDICGALGIRNVVIHPGGYGEFATVRELRTVADLRQAAFSELAEHCTRLGVRLALENVADYGKGAWGHRRFGAVMDELLELLGDIGSPDLGICLDTSHANMQGLNQPEAIRSAGERLIALHISDNDGSGDQHRTPGYGTVDWPPLIAALREIGFAADLNLEIPGECHAPPPMVGLRSVYALGVCRHLLA